SLIMLVPPVVLRPVSGVFSWWSAIIFDHPPNVLAAGNASPLKMSHLKRGAAQILVICDHSIGDIMGGPKAESMARPGMSADGRDSTARRADRHKQQGPTDGFAIMKPLDADRASAGFPVSKLERETLHDRAYLELKRAIMSGAIQPGATIT